MKKLLFILIVFLVSCKSTYLVHDSEPIWNCDFTSEDSKDYWIVSNNVFYNDNAVLLNRDMVRQDMTGLTLTCIDSVGVATTWQRTDTFLFVGANMQTWNKEFDGFTFKAPCIIEIYCNIPKSWAAFWSLCVHREKIKEGRFHSVPELDVVENNGNKVDVAFHWGYDTIKYATDSKVKKIHTPDGKYHKYAIKLLPDMYEYYFDRKLVYRAKNKPKYNNEFIDMDATRYLILTNAGDKNRFLFDKTELKIKWIKVYEI